MPDFCFVGPKFTPRTDLILFDVTDTLIEIQPGWTMAHIWHAAGKFRSISEAKRNNHDGIIPLGWSHFRFSNKNASQIFIWNPEMSAEEFRDNIMAIS